jgi:hypothetical protein
MIRAGLIILISALAAIHPVRVYAQGADSTLYFPDFNISSWYHHGYLVPHHRSMSYFTTGNINGFEVVGSACFPQLNPGRPPEIGAGYYFSTLGNRDVYGWVHGMYLSLAADFLSQRSPVYFQQSISFGLSYNTEHFDIDENHWNRAIGSHLNAFIIYSFNLRVKLNDDLIVSAGPSIVHMSNGNVKHPNFGLNLLNTRIGITHTFSQNHFQVAASSSAPEGYNLNRFVLLLSAGKRQLSRKLPESFLVGSLIGEYSRRINFNQALGVGLDIFWDPTEGRETYVTEKRVENIVPWHAGAHLSWERIWGNFSILLQPGYKLITLSEHDFYQYNRAAVRYKIGNDILVSCAIKAHGFRADFIEFGAGYSFEKQR